MVKRRYRSDKMVGSRRRALQTSGSFYGNGGSNKYDRNDVETAYGSINPIKPRNRFRDAIHYTIQEQRTSEMKKKLIDNVDHDMLEKYRKSPESVRLQKRKRLSLVLTGLHS